ncbi:hypothetical protein ACRC7T_18135 [Segnochrobactraceae bacterium EtOH-i3]
MADKTEIANDDDDADTAAALAFLTDEERALLNDDGTVPEDDDEGVVEGDDEENGEAQEAADDASDDAAADEAVTDDAATAAASEEAEEASAGEGKGETDDEAARPAPLLQPIDITGAKERIDAIPAERDAIEDRYEAGEIDAKKRRSELARLDNEMLDARLKIERASLAAEMTRQQETSRWQQSVQDFAMDHPVVRKSELTWNAFDQAVRAVTGDRANAGLSHRKILEKALASFTDAFGLPGGASEQASPKAPKKARQERAIPPTLAKMPAAAITDAGDGRWTNLDRLADRDPIAYEKAFARLSEADREAYLAS